MQNTYYYNPSRIALTLVSLLISCFVCTAQTIDGTVSSFDGTVLEGANISVLDNHSNFIVGCVSSENGNFSIQLPDNITSCSLAIRSVGMLPDTILIASLPKSGLKVVLSEDTVMLNGVTITSTRKPFKVSGDMITADVENTILSKSGSFESLMSQIPFVFENKDGYNVLGRGKAQLYINGRKLYNTEELSTLLSDRVKKVEVITNPGAKYASDVKAVIKIYTVDNPNGFGGSIFADAIMARKVSDSESASFVYNRNKLQFSGVAAFSNSRGVWNVSDSEEITSTRSATYNDCKNYNDGRNLYTQAEINYELSKNSSIGLNTELIWGRWTNNNNLTDFTHSTHGIVDFSTEAQTNFLNKMLDWTNNAYYTLNIGNTALEITNDFLLKDSHNNIDYTEVTTAAVSTENIRHNMMNSFIADANTRIGECIILNYGMELTYSRDKQSFSFDEKEISTDMSESETERRQFLNAEYTTLNFTPGKWNLSAGLRYEFSKLNYYVDGVKSKKQSKTYNDFCPNLNIAYNPNDVSTVSIGYQQSIERPSYNALNDNLIYYNRYEYTQGNSLTEPQYVHSLNFLASYMGLQLIGSYDIIKNAIMTKYSVYGNSSDIVLEHTVNMPTYQRMEVGLNWERKFGIYTPYLEVNSGKQWFEYEYQGLMEKYNKPYIGFKCHNTFSLPKDWQIKLFVDYVGSQYESFTHTSDRWSSELAISKSFGKGWFVQLTAKNLLCSSKQTITEKCEWINAVTNNDEDYRKVELIVSYTFNNKDKKHNTYTKSSEADRF